MNKSALALLSGLGLLCTLAACGDDPAPENHTGILVTGNTFALGEDTVQVAYDPAQADTATFFDHLRAAALAPPRDNLPALLGRIAAMPNSNPAAPASAWGFALEPAAPAAPTFAEQLGNPSLPASLQGPLLWSNLLDGVLDLDSGSSLQIPSSMALLADTFTLAVHLFPTGWPADSNLALSLVACGAGTTTVGYQLFATRNGRVSAGLRDGRGGLKAFIGTTPIPPRQWSAIELRKTPERAELWINGQLEAETRLALGSFTGECGLQVGKLVMVGSPEPLPGIAALYDYVTFAPRAAVGSDSLLPYDYASDNTLSGTLTDGRDGTVYHWTRIGSQTWMTENLRYGAQVASAADQAPGDKYCLNDDPALCEKYGALYQWSSAQTACPTGWHLPTDAEWKTLERTAGMSALAADSADDAPHRGAPIGQRLKGPFDWSSGNGTDLYAFSVMPSEYRAAVGTPYAITGALAIYATATESAATTTWAREFTPSRGVLRTSTRDKRDGLSVRCLMD